MLRTRFAASSSLCARRALPVVACRNAAVQQQQASSSTSVVFAAVTMVNATRLASAFAVTPMRLGVMGPDGAKRQGAFLLDKVDVLARVTEVVKNFEKVDASKVTAESHFINDLGLDSLDVVEVVMALEQEFVLDIPDHEAEKIQSIPDAVEYLCSNPMAK